MKDKILSQINTECPWRDTLYWYDTIDSTNTQAKALARQGAPHGTVLIAGSQTGGRGRLGRSFESQNGMGVYLSVILRPRCAPGELMHLTCAAGVAVCDAVEKISGIRPGIKWINDLVIRKRKLGGILTELSSDPKTGLVDYAVIGVGINCRQTHFTEGLESIATSLFMEGKDIPVVGLAAKMVEKLYEMNVLLLTEKAQLMDIYRQDCITLGQQIQIIGTDTVVPAKALDIDNDGALVALLPDGSKTTVASGEVSVRGMYGYI